MAIFKLLLEQTLGLSEVEDYSWELNDVAELQDLEYVREAILGNLILAAEDTEIFPYCIDANDFDFSDDKISFDISSYDEEDSKEIKAAFEEFESKTGLIITIEE